MLDLRVNSPHLVNPMIEMQPHETMLRCAECLAYLSNTVAHWPEQDATPISAKGLQSLLECVQHAMLYEYERLGALVKSSGSEG